MAEQRKHPQPGGPMAGPGKPGPGGMKGPGGPGHGPGGPRGMRGPRPKVENPGKLLARVMKYIFEDYLIHCIAVVILIFVSVFANVQGTLFTKNLIDDYITPFLLSDNPNFGPLAQAIKKVAVFYGIGVIASYTYNRIMICVTQGVQRRLRNELFEHMQLLPIKYFDTHAHGDIMSLYTNDIDTMRMLVSQTLPSTINSSVTIVSVFISMISLSIPLTVITLVMVAVTMFCSKTVASNSGRYFMEQQGNLGKVNCFIE